MLALPIALGLACNQHPQAAGPIEAARQPQVTSAQHSFIADTVLGAAPPAARTGDVATKRPTDLGVPDNTSSYQTILFVKGLIYPGDGGGGNFYWDSGSCTDDGIDAIVVPSSPPATLGSTGPCWRRQSSERRGPMNAGVFHLKNYVNPASCDGSGSNCDLKPAFDAALAACSSLRTAQGDTAGFKGCVLLVPEGTHRLSGTVDLCRAHVIRGEGLWRGTGLTTLVADHSGFFMRGFKYCQDNNLGQGGRSQISGLTLAGSNAQTVESGANWNEGTVGIRMEDGGLVENVTVTGFVVGIRIRGFHEDIGANANVWGLTNVNASENRFAGIYVNGIDGNAGSATRVMANWNCQRGEYWKAHSIGGDPPVNWGCAGVIDSSMLGNTWVGIHTQDSRDITTSPPKYYSGYWFAGGPYTANVCVGCYSETGELPSYMGDVTNIFGGYSNWQGPGFSLQGSTVSALTIKNTRSADYRLDLTFGTEPGVAFRLWRYAGTCSQNSGNAGAACSADSYCTNGGSCQGLGLLKSEISLQYDPYIKGYGFHINSLQSGNFGVLNFLAETGTSYSGLESSTNKLHLTPGFLANCAFSSICGAP